MGAVEDSSNIRFAVGGTVPAALMTELYRDLDEARKAAAGWDNVYMILEPILVVKGEQ